MPWVKSRRDSGMRRASTGFRNEKAARRSNITAKPWDFSPKVSSITSSVWDGRTATIDKLIEYFDVDAINQSNGEFDEEKLKWVNEQQLRLVSLDHLADHVLPIYEKNGVRLEKGAKLDKLLEMMRKRAHDLNEIVRDSMFIFRAPEAYDEASVSRHFCESTPALLRDLAAELGKIETWDEASIEDAFNAIAAKTGLKMGKIAQPARVAIVGIAQSPGIYEVVWFVGKDETVRRLEKAAQFAENKA